MPEIEVIGSQRDALTDEQAKQLEEDAQNIAVKALRGREKRYTIEEVDEMREKVLAKYWTGGVEKMFGTDRRHLETVLQSYLIAGVRPEEF